MVPTVELPPPIPLTDQATPDEPPVTLAVNGATWLAPTNADCGETVILLTWRMLPPPQPKVNTPAQTTREIQEKALSIVCPPQAPDIY